MPKNVMLEFHLEEVVTPELFAYKVACQLANAALRNGESVGLGVGGWRLVVLDRIEVDSPFGRIRPARLQAFDVETGRTMEAEEWIERRMQEIHHPGHPRGIR